MIIPMITFAKCLLVSIRSCKSISWHFLGLLPESFYSYCQAAAYSCLLAILVRNAYLDLMRPDLLIEEERAMRADRIHDCQCPQCQQAPTDFIGRMHGHMNLFLSTLDEHQ